MKWLETPYYRVTLFGPWTPLEAPRASWQKIVASCVVRAMKLVRGESK